MDLKEGFLRRVAWYWAGPAVQICIGIGMLPLTTLKLDPEDFGFFALVSAAVAVMAALAGLGGGFVLTAHFQSRDTAGRARLNSAILSMQMIASLVLGCALFALLPLVVGDVNQPVLGTSVLYAMAASGVVLATPWGLAQEIMVLEGKASTFALLSLLGSIVAALGTIVGLFALELDISALFVGDFLAKLVLFICGFAALRNRLAPCLEKKVVAEVLKIAPFSGTASAAQHFSQMIYRFLLNANASLTQVGLFVHAQSYERYALTSIKAVSRGIWPVNLAEAREADGSMRLTEVASRVTHLLIVAVGLWIAFFGRALIGVLTHGKFVEAAPYATLLFIVLMTKYTGRADLARLYVTSRGRTVSNISLMSDISGVVVAAVLIPHTAILGAVIALFAREMVYRFGIVAVTKSFQRMWQHDRWAAFGSLAILGAVVFVESVPLSIIEKTVLLLAATTAIAAVLWRNTRFYLSPRMKAVLALLRQSLAARNSAK